MRLKNLALTLLRLAGLAGLLFAGSRAGEAAPASAYVVAISADTADALPGNNICADSGGLCSLRAAVMEANAHPGPDTILLGSQTYSLTLAGSVEDAALTGDLDLTGTVTLQGVSAAASLIDATGLHDRVLDVLPGARVSLIDLTVRGGSIPTSGLTLGGGLYNGGTLTLTRVTLFGNGIGALNPGQNGGALANVGQALLDHSEVLSNSAQVGGLLNDGLLTIRSTRVISNDADFGAGIYNTGDLTVTSSQVLSNGLGINGGGLANNFGRVVILNSLFSGNRAQGGAAVFQSAGDTVIISSTLRDNRADNGSGGGVRVDDGVVHLLASTVLANSATEGGRLAIHASGVLSAANSTLTQNNASDNGGAVYQNGGAFGGYNLTIAGNNANVDNTGSATGGGLRRDGGTLVLSNTILANNLHVFNSLAFDDDCSGTFGVFSYSLVGDATGCLFTNDNTLIGQNPLLQPLADNGGPTQTMALGPGSAALEAANPAGCLGPDNSRLLTDQRGLPRHADGNLDGAARCDIGAYEVALQLFLPLLRR